MEEISQEESVRLERIKLKEVQEKFKHLEKPLSAEGVAFLQEDFKRRKNPPKEKEISSERMMELAPKFLKAIRSSLIYTRSVGQFKTKEDYIFFLSVIEQILTEVLTEAENEPKRNP